jgi:DNA polymerase-4
MEQTIFHVDMDAFYASIEQRDHPEFRGKPVIVGGTDPARGVVCAASYEARKFGVHSALSAAAAHRRCPQGVFLPVRMDHYRAISHELMSIFERFTPMIEKISVDEAFLDVTGVLHLWENDPEKLAHAIKATVNEDLQLTASVGIAPNKFLAKLASDMDKPDGLTIMPREETAIAERLAPLPATRMWGVGKKAATTLLQHNIQTIGDLQQCPLADLEKYLGSKSAQRIHRLAFGRDHRNLETHQVEKSISNETTFHEDVHDLEELRRVIVQLAEKVGHRLRKQEKFAGTLQIKVRFSDFETLTRQTTLERASQRDQTFIDQALRLFEGVRINRKVRLLGVGVTKLVADPMELRNPQLDLFEAQDDPGETAPTLDRALDRLKEKYGEESVNRGRWRRPKKGSEQGEEKP